MVRAFEAEPGEELLLIVFPPAFPRQPDSQRQNFGFVEIIFRQAQERLRGGLEITEFEGPFDGGDRRAVGNRFRCLGKDR